MPRYKTTVVEDEAVETAQVEIVDRKVYTDWGAFDKAGLKPIKIVCDENPSYRPFNEGCHTALVVKPESMKAHVDYNHGGSFHIQLTDEQGPWKDKDGNSLWKQLGELGLELQNLQCDVCNSILRLTPTTLKQHMRVHTSKNRRMIKGDWFWLTIGYGAPESADDQSLS